MREESGRNPRIGTAGQGVPWSSPASPAARGRAAAGPGPGGAVPPAVTKETRVTSGGTACQNGAMSNPMNISGHNPEKEAQKHRPPVTELTAEQCWEHLYSARFGRIATMDGDEIEITPINLVAHDEKIYFRTAQGTKLLHLILNEHVAVQADHAQGGEAWSVVVRGTARLLTDPEETRRVDELPLRPWLETTKLEYVEVTPVKVTGRLFHLGH